MATRVSANTRAAMLRALADMVDSGGGPGVIEIYGGQMPESANDPVGDQPLLARLFFSKPAFGHAAGGVIGARAIEDTLALASGRATWARVSNGDGRTLMDFDVGETDAMLNLSNVSLAAGDSVSVAALVWRMPAG